MAAIDAAECEEFVLAEMADLTGASDLRPEDGFTAAGGDSLKAILLASALEERFGVVVDIVEIFESDSLRALAARVAGVQAQA